MNKIPAFLLIIGFMIIVSSCKETGPQPSGMVGLYEVKVRLKDGVIDKKSIQDKIKTAMNEAEDEIQKAKADIDNDINLSLVDTTSIDGKIEYAAKKFGKSMAEVGIEIGDLGKNFGEAVSGLAVNSLDFSEKILKNIKFNVELQADGIVKSKESLLNLGLNNARWEVTGDDFLFSDESNDQPQKMKIVDRRNDGFTLEKDDVFLDFIKKSQ